MKINSILAIVSFVVMVMLVSKDPSLFKYAALGFVTGLGLAYIRNKEQNKEQNKDNEDKDE